MIAHECSDTVVGMEMLHVARPASECPGSSALDYEHRNFFSMTEEPASGIWDRCDVVRMTEEEPATPFNTICSLPSSGEASSGEAARRHCFESSAGLTPDTLSFSVDSPALTGVFQCEHRTVGATRPPPSMTCDTPWSTAERNDTDSAAGGVVERIAATAAVPTGQDLRERNVYVSGLPSGCRTHQFRKMCQRFGPIEASKLCGDSNRAGTKGFGFALFFHKEHALSCVMGLNGCLLEGSVLQARFADSSATPKPLAAGGAANTARPAVSQRRADPAAVPPATALPATPYPMVGCPVMLNGCGGVYQAAGGPMVLRAMNGAPLTAMATPPPLPPPPPPSPMPATLTTQNLAQHAMYMRQLEAQQRGQSQMFEAVAQAQQQRARVAQAQAPTQGQAQAYTVIQPCAAPPPFVSLAPASTPMMLSMPGAAAGAGVQVLVQTSRGLEPVYVLDGLPGRGFVSPQ